MVINNGFRMYVCFDILYFIIDVGMNKKVIIFLLVVRKMKLWSWYNKERKKCEVCIMKKVFSS